MLKMKKKCEKCDVATDKNKEAYICSYECTFCEDCANHMNKVCPNCSGDLKLRPKRIRNPAKVIASQLKKKLVTVF